MTEQTPTPPDSYAETIPNTKISLLLASRLSGVATNTLVSIFTGEWYASDDYREHIIETLTPLAQRSGDDLPALIPELPDLNDPGNMRCFAAARPAGWRMIPRLPLTQLQRGDLVQYRPVGVSASSVGSSRMRAPQASGWLKVESVEIDPKDNSIQVGLRGFRKPVTLLNEANKSTVCCLRHLASTDS